MGTRRCWVSYQWFNCAGNQSEGKAGMGETHFLWYFDDMVQIFFAVIGFQDYYHTIPSIKKVPAPETPLNRLDSGEPQKHSSG